MKLHFHKADSLYIHLADRSVVEAREVSSGVVIDFDEEGKPGCFGYEKVSTA